MKMPDDQLDDLLRTWQVRAVAPEGMAREVRARLGRVEEEGTVWDRAAAWLFRPVTVSAALAAAVVGGVMAALPGRAEAEGPGAAREDYVRSINPFMGGEPGGTVRR
jgi:hypothetical protein